MAKKTVSPHMAKKITNLRKFHEVIRDWGCEGCSLGKQEDLHGPVVLDGNLEADLMFIGESPGKEEDKQGTPFVGPAGELLTKMIEAMGMKREEVYITNAIKCRWIATPNSGKQNNTPQQEHIEACRPFIKKEIEIVDPTAIILVGKIAVLSLMPHLLEEEGKKGVLKHIVNKVYMMDDEIPTGVIYHPAYLLRMKNSSIEKYKEIAFPLKDFLCDMKSISEEEK